MARFPKDASKKRVLKALTSLGFVIVREKEHISMIRNNPDGSRTPLTLPESRTHKGIDLTCYLHSDRDSER
jgi:hypothetical protein